LSEIAESLLWLDGRPFSFNDYPMYRAIYDGRYRSTLMMCGRQVGKSTSLANFIITESVSIPFFREYYISPSKEQTLLFSNTRVGKTLAYSPLVKKHFQSPEHSDRVLHRSYTNGAENAFTYACDDADRARGFSADRVSYDEFQDMLFDAVVPVVNECMANSSYKFETYAGTPKTMEASIQYLWELSTQSEWVMKCGGCSKYGFIASDKAIGKHGPICLHCGKVLNPREGFWVDMKKHDPEQQVRLIKGFHIPQPIMPANVPLANPGDEEKAQERWNDILHKLNTYPSSRFRNEVLGVSDAIGQRLISLDELQVLCTGPQVSDTPTNNALNGVTMTMAGVDWSGGGTSGTSRTVLWVWGWVPGEQKLRTLYFRIYPGGNPVADVTHIAQVCQAYRVGLVVGDAGEGALPNSTLKEQLGAHRVTMVQYGALGQPIKWNGIDRYLADRTTMIDNYLMFLKRQGAQYPPYESCKEPIKDILNVYEEVTSSGKKIWRHAPSQPDDALHGQLFGWFAWKIMTNDLKFYA
jgi:phage terminase large subunit GpA-like protein